MIDDRRYAEDEVADILDRAVRAEGEAIPEVGDGSGLTLSELQEVGREVGVDPIRVAEAAAALEATREALPTRRSMGMPISLDRTVELPRQLTDSEWSSLRDALRRTFGAMGHEHSDAEMREWSNGNLYVLVQPRGSAHELRMGTLKSQAVRLNWLGAFGLFMGLLLLTLGFIRGDMAEDAIFSILVASAGLVALGSNAVSLPRWARERQSQFEEIAQTVVGLIAEAPDEDGGDSAPAE